VKLLKKQALHIGCLMLFSVHKAHNNGIKK